jgi:predicted  nucleic acid-binding Zn-ribbon protein
MNKLEIANKITYEINELNDKIKTLQRDLNRLLKDRETKQYFITLIEKELNKQELEVYNSLKRSEDENGKY